MRLKVNEMAPDQRELIKQLDDERRMFVLSMDCMGCSLSGTINELMWFTRADVARSRNKDLKQWCAQAGIPQDIIDYYGDLSR